MLDYGKIVYPDDPLNLKGRKRRRSIAASIVVGASVLTLSYLDTQRNVGEQSRQAIYSTHSAEVSKPAKRQRDETVLSVTIFLTSGSTWSVPADCKLVAQVDCIGAGGVQPTSGWAPGGGGAWSRSVNIAVTPSGSVNIGVGTTAGADTWFNATSAANAATLGNTVACAAKGGGNSSAPGTAGVGGAAASGTGTSKFSGGNGVSSSGSGAGGAAGPNGNGNNGAGQVGGSGDAGSGGAGGAASGGNGGNGTEYDATHGSGGGGGGTFGLAAAGKGGNYGGGGGSSTGSANPTQFGPGLIVVVYTPFPTVTGVSPNTGLIAGGASVTITGTNFTGATAVSFGGTNAPGFTVVNSTTITVNSPAHSAGVVHVTVTTAGGTSATSAADEFTYGSSTTTLIGDAGALTLTGKTATLFQTAIMPAVKGDLTLTGKDATFSLNLPFDKGDLSLIGRNAVLFTTSYVNKIDLLLQGRDATFAVTGGTAKGDLTLTGYASFAVGMNTAKGDLVLTGRDLPLTPTLNAVKGDLTLTGKDATFSTDNPVGAGDLVLTGRDAFLTPTIIATKGDLVLTPHEAGLIPIGGAGGGHRKKHKTGFEPVAKVHPTERKPEPKKPLLPPSDLVRRSPSIISIDDGPPDLSHEGTPSDLLGLQDQIYTAQDASDVEAFLRSYDQDAQDAADIADILALLD